MFLGPEAPEKDLLSDASYTACEAVNQCTSGGTEIATIFRANKLAAGKLGNGCK
jgi:hypothetical protein